MAEYQKSEKSVFVIGHKNPDTDSACSAVAYAYLKNQISEEHFEAKIAGELSEETSFVFDYFNVKPPKHCTDVRVQLKDIELRKMKGVRGDISLKQAWELMRDEKIDTLPVVDENNLLKGLITVKVIATSYMDIHDENILAASKTPFENILNAVGGKFLSLPATSHCCSGKVLVFQQESSFNVEKDDIVLCSCSDETIKNIAQSASLIILCNNHEVSTETVSFAKNKGCGIIKTELDVFTSARFINQSPPISYFMKKDSLVTFSLETTVDDASSVMAQVRHRYFPVLDNDGCYYCMLSRRNLLNKQKKQLILVDHNEKTQAVDGIDEAQILEIVDHHRIGNLETMQPIYFRNYPLGSTATIVAGLFEDTKTEIPPEIAGLLCSAIISDTLMFRSPTCTQKDKETAQKLALIANIQISQFADSMFFAGSNLKNKTAKEVFYSDFKIFTCGDIRFGVGQSNFMTDSAIQNAADLLKPYLETAGKNENVDMIFYMLTNIMEESTTLLFSGNQAQELINHAFGIEGNEPVLLCGVVSRKKQLVPALLNDIQMI